MAGAGYKLFNTGDVLTAAQVNTYLQEQTVMVFANSTARTTALSGVLAEGMMSYLQDTNAVEVYNGSSWVNVGNAGDITEVQAGVGISIASGTGPIPVITNSSTDLITTAGDILYGTAADTMARLGIGTAGQVLKVNSGATAPEWGTVSGGGFVGCFLYKNSDQSTSNIVDTLVTFNDEFFDTDSFHSTSTNTSRITIPSGKNGKYLFTFNINYAANSSGIRFIGFKKNGTLYSTTTMSATSSDKTRMQGSMVFDLVATDYVELESFQNTGGTLNILGIAGGTGEASRYGCIYLGA